jgi:hypothetical protein
MMSSLVARIAAGMAVAAFLPAAALAQAWTPGSEVIGQPIQVTTNGTTNTIYLDAAGQARIITPGGNTVAGMWSAANGQLCLGVGGAQECVPYNAPMQAGTPETLTSSCGATETWLAQNTNQAPPSQSQKGERGR